MPGAQRHMTLLERVGTPETRAGAKTSNRNLLLDVASFTFSSATSLDTGRRWEGIPGQGTLGQNRGKEPDTVKVVCMSVREQLGYLFSWGESHILTWPTTPYLMGPCQARPLGPSRTST